MKRTALITGGTRGIGLGIAQALAAESYHLILCGRRAKDDIAEVLDLLSTPTQQADYIQADLGDKEDRGRLIEEARKISAQLHVLVNNAGMAPRSRDHILDASEESFEEIIRVNLQGPYFLTQQCARWMAEQASDDTSSRPCIININSISSTVASVNRGEYCISKAGLSMSTKLWAAGLAQHNIDVFEIRPGIIKTDMTAGVTSKYDKLIAEGLLLEPRWGTPEDIGKASAMLARGDMPYATGQILTMDGGLTLERL
ncbi:MAG: 3-ketoacyl-ACP reductase [Rhodothermales bacterium]